MMISQDIIQIDQALCDGCGQCLSSCAEGALLVVNGQAQVIESRCDGALACLGSCPKGALKIRPRAQLAEVVAVARPQAQAPVNEPKAPLKSWPIQLKLINPGQVFSGEKELLIAADCVGFALPSFREFMDNRPVLIGCPKLDDVDFYVEKLAHLLKNQPDLTKVTVAIMTVPCCQGLKWAVEEAMKRLDRPYPVKSQRISIEGQIKI
ncbi:MAG: 4Fe-4S ferredoxin [Deltaproteobacteria bacterium]|jgi:Pyruvate/2-oxoacid:ferredoxin oxidoreductase delta subunit|nr:4Fe-4S ferredoxin [Deltaproteobacteria bacterium]